jgi:phage head maturation protease
VPESGFVTSDPKEIVEILRGIPGARILDLVEDETGLWVEIEAVSERPTVSPVVSRRRRAAGGQSR